MFFCFFFLFQKTVNLCTKTQEMHSRVFFLLVKIGLVVKNAISCKKNGPEFVIELVVFFLIIFPFFIYKKGLIEGVVLKGLK